MSELGETKNSSTSETAQTSLIGNQPEKVEEVTPQPEKKEEAKPVEAPAPLTASDIKIPEGMTVDEPIMTEALGIMNNAELSPQARMQALVDLQAKAMQAVSERGNKLWSDMQDKWQEDSRTQFGEALEPSLGNIAKMIDQYGGTAEQVKELRDVFSLTGAGNHPAMIRFLDNIGKPLREGTARAGSPSGGSRTPEQVMYPNMNQG